MELPPNTRKRVLLLAASVAAALLLLYLARNALFPFIVAGVLSYVLFPGVKALEGSMPWRHRFPAASRILAISVIYIAGLALIAGILALVGPPALRQAKQLAQSLPEVYSAARLAVEEFTARFSEDIPEDVRAQFEGAIASLGDLLVTLLQSALTSTPKAVANTLSFVIGVAIVPALLFYLLKDGDRMAGSLYGAIPHGARAHARRIVGMVNDSLGAYIRAQLTLMLFVGVIVFLGLFALGIEYSVLLGLVAGLTEAIPIVGPLIGSAPGIIVTLATDPQRIVWVIALYVGTQLIENSLLVPRIQGNALRLHPIVIMALLIIASEAFGIMGVLAAAPLGSIARDVFKYLYGVWSDDGAGGLETIRELPGAGASTAERELSE